MEASTASPEMLSQSLETPPSPSVLFPSPHPHSRMLCTIAILGLSVPSSFFLSPDPPRQTLAVTPVQSLCSSPSQAFSCVLASPTDQECLLAARLYEDALCQQGVASPMHCDESPPHAAWKRLMYSIQSRIVTGAPPSVPAPNVAVAPPSVPPPNVAGAPPSVPPPRKRTFKFGECPRCGRALKLVPTTSGGGFFGCRGWSAKDPTSCQFKRWLQPEEYHLLPKVLITRMRVYF